jgi:ATP-dependent helicase/nuclease subunit A
MTARADPTTLQQSASDPDASAWVDASAGTGKTKVLTDRVMRLLLGGKSDPVPPSRILCLTFTKAAAAEMSNRLNRRLAEWATASDHALTKELHDLTGETPEPGVLDAARRLLVRVLDTPGGMRIQTIHSFCQSVLARFPLEAGIPPHFDVVDERTADELMRDVQEEVITGIDPAAPGALGAALSAVTANIHELHFPELMADLARERGRLARLVHDLGGHQALLGAVHAALDVPRDLTSEQVIADACAEGTFDRDGLRGAVEALAAGSATDQKRGDRIAQWLGAGNEESRIIGFDTYAASFLTKAGTVLRKLATKKVAEAHPDTVEALQTEADRLLEARERVRRAAVARSTTAILTLGQALIDSYQRHKRAHGWLDYDDLILLTRDLVTTPGRAAWVLYKLDGGIDHILIDEAQDTNPDQWELIAAIADEFYAGEGAREGHRTSFAVGDPKQSIYSFQRADPRDFARMRRWFRNRVEGSEREWREIPLETSFRSTTAVLDAVDTVFARDVARRGLMFDDREIRHAASRGGQAGRVELWPAIEPLEDDQPPAWKPPIERIEATSAQGRLAALVADKIAALCNGDEILPSRQRPIEAGDIMVLVRRRNAFLDDLVRGLKERAVPVAGIDRLVLTNHIAVMDLISLGRFLLLPSDDLSLAEALKSPLFGLDDDDLFAIAHDRGDASLWRSLGARRERDSRLAEAHSDLSRLLAVTDLRSPYELYADLLGPAGGRRNFQARLGLDALEPVDEFLAQTLAYERTHVPSLQGFLHWLESGEVEVKRDLDVGRARSVRVMTVHGAKGLQAPIVFLPDTLQVPQMSPRLVWSPDGNVVLWPPSKTMRDSTSREWIETAKERRDEEYRRLLYVAMTRAEDRLYVGGWHTRNKAPEHSWYNLMRDALEEGAITTTEPLFDPAPVLRRESPQTAEPDQDSESETVVPGDPLPAWARAAPAAEPSPPVPLVPSAPTQEDPPARSPLLPEDRRAAVRGQLIHRLLQSLPSVEPARRAAAAAAFLARPGLDIDADARGEIATAALAVLEDDAFAPVFADGSLAEVAIAGLLPGAEEQHSLSGKIDRLAVTNAAVLIVDYKTNRRPPTVADQVPAAYLRQMAIYRAGLSAIYDDRPIRCALLWTEGPTLMPLADDVLDGYAP